MLLAKPFLALQQQDRNSLEAAAASLSRGIAKAVALGQLRQGGAAAGAATAPATATAGSSAAAAGGRKSSAAAKRGRVAAGGRSDLCTSAEAAAAAAVGEAQGSGHRTGAAGAAPGGSALDALQLGVAPPVRVRSHLTHPHTHSPTCLCPRVCVCLLLLVLVSSLLGWGWSGWSAGVLPPECSPHLGQALTGLRLMSSVVGGSITVLQCSS